MVLHWAFVNTVSLRVNSNLQVIYAFQTFNSAEAVRLSSLVPRDPLERKRIFADFKARTRFYCAISGSSYARNLIGYGSFTGSIFRCNAQSVAASDLKCRNISFLVQIMRLVLQKYELCPDWGYWDMWRRAQLVSENFMILVCQKWFFTARQVTESLLGVNLNLQGRHAFQTLNRAVAVRLSSVLANTFARM